MVSAGSEAELGSACSFAPTPEGERSDRVRGGQGGQQEGCRRDGARAEVSPRGTRSWPISEGQDQAVERGRHCCIVGPGKGLLIRSTSPVPKLGPGHSPHRVESPNKLCQVASSGLDSFVTTQLPGAQRDSLSLLVAETEGPRDRRGCGASESCRDAQGAIEAPGEVHRIPLGGLAVVTPGSTGLPSCVSLCKAAAGG